MPRFVSPLLGRLGLAAADDVEVQPRFGADGVGAVATVYGIHTGVIGVDQLVFTPAAAQGVNARAAIEEFIPLAAGQGVAAGAGRDRVVTETAGDSTGRGSSTPFEAADTSCAHDPAGPTAQSFCRT